MRVSDVCADYFGCFKVISKFKNNNAKTNGIAALKILSHIIFVIPLGFGIAYGISSLYGRVNKKPPIKAHIIDDHAKNKLDIEKPSIKEKFSEEPAKVQYPESSTRKTIESEDTKKIDSSKQIPSSLPVMPASLTYSKKYEWEERKKSTLTSDSSLLLNHQAPAHVKAALDKIFTEPLPSFESKECLSELINRGVEFDLSKKDSSIGFLKSLDFVIKLQRNEFILKNNLQYNFQQIVMNDNIRDCIVEKNLKHITSIQKFIYSLPTLENDHAVNDKNTVVVAERIKPITVDFDEIIDEQYSELLTVVANVKYAELIPANLTWVEEDGIRKIAFLNTEDKAMKFIASDDRLQMHCRNFNQYDTPWPGNKESLAIAEIAEKFFLTGEPEKARKMIQLLLTYHGGLRKLMPHDQQIQRKAMFAKATAAIEKELQVILNQMNISHTVKLT